MTAQQGRLGPGHQIAGRFQVYRLLGAGEMGEVYDVREMSTGYAYALKLMKQEAVQNPEAWAALCEDVRRASSLDCESIAKVFDAQVEPSLGMPYLLGEYVTFQSLNTLVSSQGPMGIHELEALFRVVAGAIDLAHQNGLVHRALKPHNIFVNLISPRNWQIRITDFGMGAGRTLSPPPPGWTATPGWLSAEQADPSTPPAPTMDVYALGLVMFYALTGKSPFKACQSSQPDLGMLYPEMTAPLPPASRRAAEVGSALSPTLDPWFERALAVSPSRRFASASEMSAAFASLVGLGPRATLTGGSRAPGAAAAHGIATTLDQGSSSGMKPLSQAGMPAGMPLVAHSALQTGSNRLPPPGVRGTQPQGIGVLPPHQSDGATAGVPPAQQQPTAASASDARAVGRSSKAPLLIAIAFGLLVVVAGVALVAYTVLRSTRVAGSNSSVPSASASASSETPVVATPSESSVPSAPPASEPAGTASQHQPESPPTTVETDSTAQKPEEKPKDALVMFECNPACDEVLCDGSKISDPVAGVRMTAGRHSCQAKAAGYNQANDTFVVTAGTDVKREIKFVKPAVVVPTSQPTRTAPPRKNCGTVVNPCN